MEDKLRIGIIICDRYKSCAGGKCFRASEQGTLSRSTRHDWNRRLYELRGLPRGNSEYAGEECK